jgi:hypothetical protein
LSFARSERASGWRAFGLEVGVGREANEVSVVFVLLVFERRQVVPGWRAFGSDIGG